ncbi:MAG: tRNA epoxyqueuosine(34) reductase QueG [Planctomycetota bacterium]
MSPEEKAASVRRIATSLGFDRIGIARAEPIDRAAYLRDWLERGYAGRMDYLRHRFEQRIDPRMLLAAARSVIVVALNYQQPTPKHSDDEPTGRVAKYAWGDDYHKIVKDRLWATVHRMRSVIDEPFEARVCVDTSPVLEREWAAAAGIGWIGKNTMVLDPKLGSYFFLGEIITTLDLACDTPATHHCGTCTRCLDACPTRAFPAPYQMDASRCISYLTIELRDEVPTDFRGPIGDWIFGCDICQEVCPFNSDAPASTVFAIRAPGPFPTLKEMLAWTSDDYRDKLRGSAMKRAKLPMLKRNAAIALANLTAR